jgi:hypothetical protein
VVPETSHRLRLLLLCSLQSDPESPGTERQLVSGLFVFNDHPFVLRLSVTHLVALGVCAVPRTDLVDLDRKPGKDTAS